MNRWSAALFLCCTLSLEASASPSIQSREAPNDALGRQFDVRLDHAAPIKLTCTEPGNSNERHLLSSPNAADHTITLHGLKAATRYTCTVQSSDGSKLQLPADSFITAPLPLDLTPPRISVRSANLAQTAYTLYNYGRLKAPWRCAGNYLVILDAEGNVRWYLPGPGCGDVDVSYLGNDRFLYGGWGDIDYTPTIVGLDKKVQFQAVNEASVPYESASSFNHDAGLSADGKSIFTLTYSSVEGIYTAFVLKQIDLATNKVVWTWDSVGDGVNLGQLPAGSSSNSDPFHANAIDDHWENGRLYLYLNMRNQYQTIKIDYETKQVVWRLGYGGDFTLLEADGTPADKSRWFSDQHDGKIVGNQFIVHDNGTDDFQRLGGTPHSRALRLELDTNAMTARIVFEWTEANWAEPIWGGHDLLSTGNSLVCIAHCSRCGTPAHNSALIELAPSGSTVWRADFRTDAESSYRAERIGGCAIFNNAQYCPTLR